MPPLIPRKDVLLCMDTNTNVGGLPYDHIIPPHNTLRDSLSADCTSAGATTRQIWADDTAPGMRHIGGDTGKAWCDSEPPPQPGVNEIRRSVLREPPAQCREASPVSSPSSSDQCTASVAQPSV